MAAFCLAIVLAGCGNGSSGAQSAKLTTVTVAMGYFPNVQFAPFYVAIARGYYRTAGIDVHLQYGIEPSVLREASQGRVDFAISGGDEVLAAAAQGLHVRYVMTQYSRFPSAVFSLKSAGIRTPQDLRGHTVGIPGRYGASYVGPLALLQAVGVPESAVSFKVIGFTQVPSVVQHKVDAAVGYAMNEPVQLRSEGQQVNEIDIYHYANLAGVGMAAGDTLLARRPTIVRAFVQATLHGMRDTLANPNEAFRISESTVKEIRVQAKAQRPVLQRCLDFWRAEPGHPLGWIDPAIWRTTAAALYRYKQISHPVTASSYYTERFVPGA